MLDAGNFDPRDCLYIMCCIEPVAAQDTEEAISELQRLTVILWSVHRKHYASAADRQGVYDSLVRWQSVACVNLAPNRIIETIFAITNDLQFTVDTMKQLRPDIVIENGLGILQ